MRTSILVGMVLAAALVALMPSVSATDIVCLNSGADCVYTQVSGTDTRACAKAGSADVEPTCPEPLIFGMPENNPDYGVCFVYHSPEGFWVQYSCPAGPGGIGCFHYWYQGREVQYGCTVALGWEGHAACVKTNYSEFANEDSYVACVL